MNPEKHRWLFQESTALFLIADIFVFVPFKFLNFIFNLPKLA